MTNLPNVQNVTNKNDVTFNASLSVKIPIDLDFDKLPNRFKKNKKRGKDQLAYIVGMLAYKSDLKKLKDNTYHSLSRDIMMQLFRGNYKNLLTGLVNAGIIKEYSNPYTFVKDGKEYYSNGTYKIGVSSKKYALVGDKIIFKEYKITDKKLIDKINKARIERTQRIIKNNPTAFKIYESIKKLSINEAEAVEYLYKKYKRKIIISYGIALVRKIGKQKTRQFIQEIQKNQKSLQRLKPIFKKYGLPTKHCKEVRTVLHYYNKMINRLHQVYVIKEIQNGNHSFISMAEDKKTGRLYHTLTMTPKDLKPFLLLDNEPLKEFDASNSQWWQLQKVLHILVSNEFYINFSKNKAHLLYHKHKDLHIHINKQTHYFYMCYTFLQKNSVEMKKEVAKLESVLYNGTFRKLFVDVYDRKNISDQDLDKKIKLKLISQVLYSDPHRAFYKNLPLVKKFRSLFPLIYKMIKDLKSDLLNNHAFGYTDGDRWKCLSLLLSKMEADIFIKDMANTDAIFLTLHDAIVTNDSNYHKVYKSITESVKKREIKMIFK